ncbi:RecQ family ATP-dependent DNA helicase [Enterococcus diestrammenae]|uniref:RecQ family ATP-dependent DNA helicase n=1 Tax=Enterococcus diestrammenae TaxID=1155073 RepID=UPI00195B0B3F
MLLKLALKSYFDYDEFRPGQREIIESLLSGHDTLGILPTGTGKSLCYQLAGYLTSGLVVVVSPLIALMEDQVAALQARGEKRAIALTSQLTWEEKSYLLQRLHQYKFLFVSPEMLQNPPVLAALQKQELAFMVVDEAHCLSQWGIDFRPEYRLLPECKKALGNLPVLALTATATAPVAKDIATQLLDADGVIHQFSADRPNIAYFVYQPADKRAWLLEFLRQTEACGLIYCVTRSQVEALYECLRGEFSVGYYHGGLESDQRKLLQQQFSTGKLQLMIATNAFGMGINKGDLRFVIHYELPDSPENYLQESGRAGRDGEAAQAILLYQSGDEQIHRYFHQKLLEERQGLERLLTSPSKQSSAATPLQEKWLHLIKGESGSQLPQALANNEANKEARLQAMLGYIHEPNCRRQYLLRYFDEEPPAAQEPCCDLHGATLVYPKGEQRVATLEEKGNWRDILLKLFKDDAGL